MRIGLLASRTLAEHHLRARLRVQGQDLMHAALKKVADPGFTPRPLQELGPVYTLPNLRQWITLNARVANRRLRCRW